MSSEQNQEAAAAAAIETKKDCDTSGKETMGEANPEEQTKIHVANTLLPVETNEFSGCSQNIQSWSSIVWSATKSGVTFCSYVYLVGLKDHSNLHRCESIKPMLMNLKASQMRTMPKNNKKRPNLKNCR